MKIYEAKNKSDYIFISGLINPENNKFLLVKKVSAEEIELDHSRLKHYFIIENDGILIGYFNIFISDDNSSARIALVIDKPYQGRGFGFETMKIIEAKANEYGVKLLKLDVLTDNISAINLYVKVGFIETHKISFMEKKIAD